VSEALVSAIRAWNKDYIRSLLRVNKEGLQEVVASVLFRRIIVLRRGNILARAPPFFLGQE
jgi:hypothetical protein